MTEEKTKKKETKGGMDIDLGLGGFFKGIENLVNMASKLKNPGEGVQKKGKIDLSHFKEGMKGIFGFSFKTAAGGKTVVEPFGNIKKTPEGPAIKEEREPITDVFDEQGEIKVYAEMPGISREDIELELKDDILTISAKNVRYKFHKEVMLPAIGNDEAMISNYKNGVLELSIKKA